MEPSKAPVARQLVTESIAEANKGNLGPVEMLDVVCVFLKRIEL